MRTVIVLTLATGVAGAFGMLCESIAGPDLLGQFLGGIGSLMLFGYVLVLGTGD